MPAYAKLATALAMSLALVGAGTSLAQSTTALASHTAYVSMVDVVETPGAQEWAGTVSCDVPEHERMIRETLGRPTCLTDKFAYVYPSDGPAPWTASIEDVDQQTYVDEAGTVRQVAEVSYQTISQSPEGGPELVKAMASEIRPEAGGGDEGSYALPMNEELLEEGDDALTVDVGPAPGEASQTALGAD